MSLVKILVADEIDLAPLLKLNTKKYLIKHEFGISNENIIKLNGDFDVLVIRSIRRIDKDFLDKVSFRIIATGSKGTDHIDVAYAEKKGIKILNADDANNISAAEHTLALILAIEKKIIFSDNLVRNDKFRYYNYERNELNGKSIGIVGFGKVGSHVGKLCKAFGMKVYANDIDKNVKIRNKSIVFKSLKYLFNNCDIISLHIPLNKKNFHFISDKKINLLNRNTILINTSRGDVIDEKYLLRMLKESKIKYAGLDVFSHEPNVDTGFRDLGNVVLTNHIAGKTVESKRKISESILKQISNFYR